MNPLIIAPQTTENHHHSQAHGRVSHTPVGRRHAVDRNPVLAKRGNGGRDRLPVDLSCLGATDSTAGRERAAFDPAHWAQIAFGCFVPAAISGANILARLTRR
jgi:hypothetical protein